MEPMLCEHCLTANTYIIVIAFLKAEKHVLIYSSKPYFYNVSTCHVFLSKMLKRKVDSGQKILQLMSKTSIFQIFLRCIANHFRPNKDLLST